MCDDLASSTVATRTPSLLEAAASAHSISLAGRAPSLAPGFLSAISGTIDLASVAAAADDYVATAART